MPFSRENEGTAVGSISASLHMGRMLVNEFDLWLLGLEHLDEVGRTRVTL